MGIKHHRTLQCRARRLRWRDPLLSRVFFKQTPFQPRNVNPTPQLLSASPCLSVDQTLVCPRTSSSLSSNTRIVDHQQDRVPSGNTFDADASSAPAKKKATRATAKTPPDILWAGYYPTKISATSQRSATATTASPRSHSTSSQPRRASLPRSKRGSKPLMAIK